jgi:hypothetical protein
MLFPGNFHLKSALLSICSTKKKKMKKKNKKKNKKGVK